MGGTSARNGTVHVPPAAATTLGTLRRLGAGAGMACLHPRGRDAVECCVNRFPDLRLCIQTGFDQEDKWGWLRYRHMIVPAGNLDQVEPATLNLNGETPLAGELKLDANSIPVSIGQTLTNKQVLQKKLWSTFSSILQKKYHEVEGVGVIF